MEKELVEKKEKITHNYFLLEEYHQNEEEKKNLLTFL